jgi:hypothetical protein
MVVDQFHIAARRDLSLHGSYSLVRIAGRYNPKLERAATRGCRPDCLYPDEECFSHAINMAWPLDGGKLAVTVPLVPFAPECRREGPHGVAESDRLRPAQSCRDRVGRYKAIIGPKLRARILPAQQGETAIVAAVLNHMIRVAKPASIRAT